MAGIVVKDYKTIIMDGSDETVVRKIIDIIDKMTAKRYGASTEHIFDEDHPTMKVIETTTTSGGYLVIKNVLNKTYPGLCVFDPPM